MTIVEAVRTSGGSSGYAGKPVVVTGGDSEHQRAVVAQFTAAGAQVISAERSRPELAADLFVQADVSTAKGVQVLATCALDEFGGVDVVLHVRGLFGPAGRGLALADAHWQSARDTNLLAGVRLDRALVPRRLPRLNVLASRIAAPIVGMLTGRSDSRLLTDVSVS